MELRVFYDSEDIITELDKAIEKVLEPFGLRRWASGYDFVGRKRDLAFTDKHKEVPEPNG
jgi:hypothetical protein